MGSNGVLSLLRDLNGLLRFASLKVWFDHLMNFLKLFDVCLFRSKLPDRSVVGSKP
jgi:hypothetical protein